ncbi:MAG: hypothetical protein Q7R48_03900 [bacterium]|nr:hypothetical protein [bacterium]
MSHLVPPVHEVEEVAFLLAQPETSSGTLRLVVKDVWRCGPGELAHQSAYHIALTDKTKAALIKRAHDAGCAVIEAHSHVGDSPAEFSHSDHSGFEEFVPHIRWRLKGLPYAAIVVTRQDMDGFVWSGQATTPERLGGIEVDGSVSVRSNRRSSLTWRPTINERF